MMILIRAECACHVWIINALEGIGKCRRCKQTPERLPGLIDDPDAKTICKHEGACAL